MNFPTKKLMYDVQMSTTLNDTADIYIYSEIQSNEESLLGKTKESETSANAFRKKLEAIGGVKNINLYINSTGGSCMEGNAIYSMLKRNRAYITAYIDGFACSEASIIPMACDKIVMQDNAVMMIYNPWIVAMGNAKQLRAEADNLDVMSEAFRQAYMSRFNRTEKKLIELLDNETYLTAKQCIEYGLADEIAGFTVPNQLKKATDEDEDENEDTSGEDKADDDDEDKKNQTNMKGYKIDNTMQLLKSILNI